ncbi:hypothetical protein [uncultured Vagococcus sp.]|uniref:hypothetical protein n=1 Tax=uncultured Vagococcus sp. TaxID=189676 RepID=UPI00258E8F0E|nr:hypothetical protein [uncultured Vagococcus sp.]
MKTKIIKKNQGTFFLSTNLFIIPIPMILISIMFIKLFQLTEVTEFLFLAITILLIAVTILVTVVYKTFKNYQVDKNNPLSIYKSKDFENFLVKSGFSKEIDEENLEIPQIQISQCGEEYYLDIQEFYLLGDKLIESKDAINAYSFNLGCDLTIIECFRLKGFIRYVFIKNF